MPKTKNNLSHMAKIYTALNKERAVNKIFYLILKYFIAKKNSMCYTIYNVWIILLCESTVYTV